MEIQKVHYQTRHSAYSVTVAESDDPHQEFIPHEKARETISKIEALKEAHADVPSFLPVWADDKYFQSMHEERKADRGLFITPYEAAGSTKDEVESEILDKECVHEQDIDKEKVKTFLRGIIEKACRELPEEVHEKIHVQDIDKENVKAFVRGIIEKACRELPGEVQEKSHVQDIDKEKVRTFVNGIIEKACRELRREDVFQQFQITIDGKVRRTSNICREKDKSIAFRAIHKLLMKPVLEELIQHTHGKARSFRDSVLHPTTEKDFVARSLFLTQSFGAVCDQVAVRVGPAPKSAQRVLPQYTFLHTAGIPSAGISCVDNKRRQQFSWKKRILTCFGL